MGGRGSDFLELHFSEAFHGGFPEDTIFHARLQVRIGMMLI